MSKPRCSGSNIHKLLLASEAGQKSDILAYSSGHLGPRSLNQCKSHRETKASFLRLSHSRKETPIPLTLQQTMTPASPPKKDMKKSLSEFTTGRVLLAPIVPRSTQDQVTERSSRRRKDVNEHKMVNCSTKSHKKPSSDPEEKRQLCTNQSDQADLKKDGRLKMRQPCGRKVKAHHDLWGRMNVAEMHERKLQKELEKLSAQSCPSRDRLVVFSDVFDDVCEDSPVFGHILREIKTDYDLYVNHLLASHSSLVNKLSNVSLEALGDVKVSEMDLEDAEKEVCMLEQEARRALEENHRARNELQDVPANVGPEDRGMQNAALCTLMDTGAANGCMSSVQSKRLQVFHTWSEIQQLEVELVEKLVSSATTTAAQRRIGELKKEIMRLIASIDRLRATNKSLENNINLVLKKEKVSKAIRRMLWDEIRCDLQADSK